MELLWFILSSEVHKSLLTLLPQVELAELVNALNEVLDRLIN